MISQSQKKCGASFRYLDDIKSSNLRSQNVNDLKFKNFLFKNGLLINKYSSSKIDFIIEEVCKNLYFPKSSVNVFIYSSSDIQGLCYPISKDECIIQLSSGLVNLMNEKELAFVIGHELGHFILDHGVYDEGYSTTEKFIKMRAQEISVDRFGLLACRNLDSAMSAMIKTLSGLDEKYIDLDVANFINQARLVEKEVHDQSYLESHPSIVLRCRALLLFSTSGIMDNVDENNIKLEQINASIKRELEIFVDAPINEKLNTFIEDYKIWKSVQIILSDGTFNKEEQNKFEKNLEEYFKKIIEFLSDQSKSEVEKNIKIKINEVKNSLNELIPNSCNKKNRKFR